MLKHISKIAIITLAIASLSFASCGAKKDSEMPNNVKQASMNDQAAMDKAAAERAAAERAAAEKAAMDQAAAERAANMAAMPSVNSVYFAFDSAVIDAAGQSVLSAYATWLNKNSDVNITVEGNCDERGSREYNLALGEERAKSVRNVLVSNGVAASRIDTVSFGEERPMCTGSGEACWAQNRHGDVVNR